MQTTIDYHAAIHFLAKDKEVSDYDIFCFSWEWFYGGTPAIANCQMIERQFSRFLKFESDAPHYVRAYVRAAYAVLEA